VSRCYGCGADIILATRGSYVVTVDARPDPDGDVALTRWAAGWHAQRRTVHGLLTDDQRLYRTHHCPNDAA
jgi:hypothetical protein